MHPGSDPMGAPASFATRRPHAAHLGNFELPPPPMHKYSSFHSVSATQSSQAPTTIASVGNLLTPPNNIPGDVLSPSSGVSASGAHSSAMPQYGNYVYSPPAQGSAQYGYGAISQQQNQYNTRGLNPPPSYQVNQQLPPFAPASTPLGAGSNLTTMTAQEQQSHHMMGAQTPVSSSAPQQSPAHTQEAFQRPPPTPTYYGSQPASTPQQSTFPYSTGPSPTQQSPISAGPMPRMSPAVSQGQMSSIPSMPAQSPHAYTRPYGAFPPPPQHTHAHTHAPVYSNMGNPNGQLALVGGMHPGMMAGFNSGHAASMPHFLAHPHQQQQAANDRPFKCDQCPQSFNRNHDLKRHKRIHLAVKPFPCTHCDKSFSRKDALKRHILVKGCGKATNNEEKRESHSPDHKAEALESKPIISSHA
ncbi:hypothetical protein BU24DRAFT_147869 [Aaosphaeria arxii CBS 175.79]|uniref:C2H2-type domain-containing protein n=1 Tax=Aaosphaeria arxii CBS 175.79 TaxID=1450172 RepID=A0A6A5XWE8_9PLEO|nr:uncharacterized protein BU24DRAFT_147869 [Aaosphaeria arxii CBS 175.79]KAF2017299.1 hypothetical protein BU24DRAFT_147869 [Aaosphaeria arxii CBS 175.79]